MSAAITDATGSAIVDERINKSPTIVQCPCHNFADLSKILDILDSENDLKGFLEWIGGEVDEIAVSQNKLLSCGKRSRCRFRYGTSFAVLNDIRDACRPFLDTTTTTTSPPQSGSNSNVLPTNSAQPNTVSYEAAFPSLSSKPTEKEPLKSHPAASNILVPPSKPLGTKQQATTSTVNTLVGKKTGKRRIRPQPAAPVAPPSNSVWTQRTAGALQSGSNKGSTTAVPSSIHAESETPNKSDPLKKKTATIITLNSKPNLDENQGPALSNGTKSKSEPWKVSASNTLIPPSKPPGLQQQTATTTVNTLVGKKKGKRRITLQTAAPVAPPANSVWAQHPAGSVSIESSKSGTTTLPSLVPADTAKIDKSAPPRQEAAIVQLDSKSSSDENRGLDHSNETSSKTEPSKMAPDEHVQRLADIYIALAKNLLISSTALELHLLLRLVTLDTDASPKMKPRPSQAFFGPIFSNHQRCKKFAKIALSSMENVLRNLPLSLLDSLVQSERFRVECPALCENLNNEIQHRHKHGLMVDTPSESVTGPHAMLSLPFDKERDSRHNYKTQAEVTLYKNREETRDAFLYQLRSFMSTKGRVFKPEELEKNQDRMQVESKKTINGVLSGNMGWFAHFFCDLLLQIGLSPVEETDQDLLNIADRDRLQRLHKRFSSRNPHSNRSSKKLVLSQQKESASLSPFSEALARFPGYQECFFLFVYAGNNYNFGINLKACLVLKILGLLNNQSPNQFERRLAELQLLSRFLGFLVFSPNWRSNEIDPSKFKTTGVPNGIKQLESVGLPLDDIVEKAWSNGHAIITIPWIAELLKMAKWDSQTQTSRSFRQLLANLRQIQAATYSTDTSSSGGRFGPSMQVVNFVLEALFDDTPSLPSSMPRGSLEDNHRLEPDCLDFERIGFSTVTFFSSNPHVEDLSNLINGLHRIQIGRGVNKSRKLRPSIISLGPSTRGLVSIPDDMNDSKAIVAPWAFSETDTSNNDSDLSPSNKVKTKLSEIFFHQHRDIKEICEFTIDRVLKNTSGELLRDTIAALFQEKELNSNLKEQDIETARQKVLSSSAKVLRSRLEDSVQKSLQLLGPPNTNPKVMAIAISLAVEKGMITGAALLGALISDQTPFLRASIEKTGAGASSSSTTFNDSSPASDSGHIDELVQLLGKICEKYSTPPQKENVDEILQALSRVANILEGVRSSTRDRLMPESNLRILFGAILKVDRYSASFIQGALSLEEAISRQLLLSFLQVTTLLYDTTNFMPQKVSTSAELGTVLGFERGMGSSTDPEGNRLIDVLKNISAEGRIELSFLVEIGRRLFQQPQV